MDEQGLLMMRCELESLITQREGMIAENKQCEIRGCSMAYPEDSFKKITTLMDGVRLVLSETCTI